MANTINTNLFTTGSMGGLDSMFSTGKTEQSAGVSNMLGDMTAIRNGSYKKLLNAYYDKDKQETGKGSTKASKEVDKNVTELAQSAKEMKRAADALRTTGKNSLFVPEQVTTTDEETGHTTTKEQYKLDDIFDAAEQFVKAFNDMLTAANEVANRTTEKKMALTENMLAKNAKLLKDVGIKVEASGKLSIDKEKFMKADINDLKTVFNGSGSIADRMAKRANDLFSTAEKILSTDGGTYRRSGALTKNVKTGTRVDEEL